MTSPEVPTNVTSPEVSSGNTGGLVQTITRSVWELYFLLKTVILDQSVKVILNWKKVLGQA